MPRRIRSWLAWLLPALLLLLAQPAMADAPRLALVIGNAAYPARPLATAANDAALVAQALAQAGFDVTAARDLDAERLRATLAAFVDAARAAGPDATLFVYLAGYGLQYDGGNFFVPTDARLVHDDDVPAETASLDDFVRALAAVPAKARLVVVDASRTQPFATADEMPLAPGLAATNAPAGTLVAFASAPGMAAPNDALPYGAYARALAETIAAPGISPGILFDRVRLRVGMLTNGAQVPWDDGTLPDGLALKPAVAPAAPAPAPQPPGGSASADTAYSVVIARDALASFAEFLRIVPDGPLATRIRVLQAIRREATIWQAAAASDDPRADWTYMRRYPRGPHRFDARRRLASLHAALEPPPRFDPFVFPALPPPTPAELPLVAAPAQALRGLPSIPPPPAALLPPADPAYYDELPMPAPAPGAMLPIAPPLPGAAGVEPGRIRQAPRGRAATVSETQSAPDGSASITLADAAGPVAELVASGGGDKRTLVETGPPAPEPAEAAPGKSGPMPKAHKKVGPPIVSRTIVTRTPAGVTITQADGDGAGLLEIATTADADGARTTRVTDGRNVTLASWRRDPQGIVVAADVAPSGDVAMPATAAAPAGTPPPAGPSLEAGPPNAKPVAPKPMAPRPMAPRPMAPRPMTPQIEPSPAVPRPAPSQTTFAPSVPVAPSIRIAPSIPVAPAAPPRSTTSLTPPVPIPAGPTPPTPAASPSPVSPKPAPPSSESPPAARPAPRSPAAPAAAPSTVPLPPPRPVPAKPMPSKRPQVAPGKPTTKPKPSAAKRVAAPRRRR